MKHKDHYDMNYGKDLAKKIIGAYPEFESDKFIELLSPTLENLEFNDRQVLIAESLKASMNLDYPHAIQVFESILGPELEGSLGMFTEGFWLWPIGKYVELYGAEYFELSTNFSAELTKRFTGEYSMRPVILRYPKESMELLLQWSIGDNKRVRRLASECIRIRLPWAKKMYIALEYFDEYVELLTNLKDDTDKTIQKSVANNLNDLYKEDVEKFEYIISLWTSDEMSKESQWIIKHGSRTKEKKK